MKILVTGGHVTPAIAVIDELKAHEVIFVGRKYAQEGENTTSFEYQEVTRRGIKFIDLKTGRLTRTLTLRTLINFLRIPLGFVYAFKIIFNEKPDRVLSFGGYLAVPIAFWAWTLRIPVFAHEQTVIPGLANRFVAKFAKKIFISFDQTQKYFQNKKIIITGNPIRKSIFKTQKAPFSISKEKPVIFISGGSLGSHSVNIIIERNIRDLLKNYVIIHQTGSVERYEDFDRLHKLKQSLPEDLRERYFIRKHFYEDEYGFVYSVSDLLIGRSGANTFFELIAVEKPAIFIPLPWAGYKEQEKQARIFKEAGAGDIFYQEEQDEKLLALISNIITNKEEYKNNFKKLKSLYKKDAAKIITQEILKN